MAAGASFSYTCSRPNVTKDFHSVATSTGRALAGRKVTASDRAPIKVTALSPPRKKSAATRRPRRPVITHLAPKATG
jgi:hypothetical protein